MPSAELEAFHRSLQRIDGTRSRMEDLFVGGSVRKTDIEAIYEALFLRAVTSFENFLENLFISIMLGKSGHTSSKASSVMRANSRSALMGILLQNNNYLDWLPYGKTENRAKIYLKNGKPFLDLSDGDKSQINAVTLIRNAIAHKSEHAKTKFKEKVIGNRLLLKHEKTPSGFLRSQVRANPRQVRFEVYVSELGRIATSLY